MLEIERFDELISTMDLPESRKHDWVWLLRNMWIRNASNPNFKEAYKIVKKNYRFWIKGIIDFPLPKEGG